MSLQVTRSAIWSSLWLRFYMITCAIIVQSHHNNHDPSIGPIFRVPIYAMHSEDVYPPETSYFTQISLGTPAQSFKVQFDTTIDYIWVPMERNDISGPINDAYGFNCSNSASCIKANQDNASENPNLLGTSIDRPTKTTTIIYRDANFEANIFEDKLNLNGLNDVIRLQFAAITSSDSDSRKLPVDGFFGLPRQAKTRFNISEKQLKDNTIIKTFMDKIYSELNYITENRFAIWFHKQANWGEILFGGDDSNRFLGYQLWHSVSNNETDCGWIFDTLKPVAFGNTIIGCERYNCLAKLDSGSTHITGPRKQVNKLYELIGAKILDQIAYIDCDRVERLRPIVFVIENAQYSISPRKYVRKLADNKCYIDVSPNNSSDLWTLGTTFMSNYYISFDVDRQLVAINYLR